VSAVPPNPVSAASATPVDPMMQIVDLQNLDGSWSDAGIVAGISGKSLSTFTSLQTICSDKDAATFATILAVATLRHLCSTRQSSWRLIERKALDWLFLQFHDPAAVEDLILRTIALLSSA
jgi:hypothetical protein